MAGSRQKLDKYGRPYGWHINAYEMVEDWVPKEWIGAKISLDREEAADIIFDAGTSMGNGISREKLAKVLGIV